MWSRVKQQFNFPSILGFMFLVVALFKSEPDAWKFCELGMFWLIIGRIDYAIKKVKS